MKPKATVHTGTVFPTTPAHRSLTALSLIGRCHGVWRMLLLPIALWVFGGVFLQAALAASPNIVLIVTDDQGFGDVSYAPSPPDLETPNIDSLAALGIRFNNFYANSPVCSPTRASLLTGRYPGMVGVPGVIRSNLTNTWGYLSPQSVTLPELLRNAGYYTAHVGKWHLGLESPNLPNERGYDYFHGFLGDMMDDYCTHLRGGVDYMRENHQPTTHTGVHATRLFTQWAIDFISERAQFQQPFFLTLWYNAPHVPLHPPHETNPNGCPIDPEAPENRSTLVKLIEDIDDQIGTLIQAIDDSGKSDDTLLMFLSDNGGQLDVGAYNGPYRGGKQEVYDGGIRVPMVAVWPAQVPAPQSSDTVAMTMDLFPTILEAAGVQVPDGIDGTSLLPILTQGGSPTLDRISIWERLNRKRIGKGMFAVVRDYALRDGDWKLVKKDPTLPNEPGNFELFDVAPDQDPYESTDQCATHPSKCAALQADLAAYVDQEQYVPWRPSVPSSGSPFAVGERIEAEDFDAYLVDDALVGAEGAGYHDREPENLLGGDHRPGEGVDIRQSDVASAGFNVGSAKAGEWLAYSIDVPFAGSYRVASSVAAPSVGGTFHIEFDGVDVSGPMTIPATGGWQQWFTIETPEFQLGAAVQRMRVVLDSNRPGGEVVGNFDWFELSTQSEPPAANRYPVTIAAVGARPASAWALIDENADGSQNLSTLWKNLGKTSPETAWATLDLLEQRTVAQVRVPDIFDGKYAIDVFVGDNLVDGKVSGGADATCPSYRALDGPLNGCDVANAEGRYVTIQCTNCQSRRFKVAGVEAWAQYTDGPPRPGKLPVGVGPVGAHPGSAWALIDENADGSQNLSTLWKNSGKTSPETAWATLDLHEQRTVAQIRVPDHFDGKYAIGVFVGDDLVDGKVTGGADATCPSYAALDGPLNGCDVANAEGRYVTIQCTNCQSRRFKVSGSEVWGH